jgi:DNA (cytosine-5)-methyltransferase 1
MKHDKGKTWEVIINVFKTLGYFLKIEMLNSADYGIPQNRRRVFVIGFKNKEDSDKYCTPQKKELLYKAQDFLINNVPFKSFTSKNGELILNKKKGNIPEETILSEKIQKYVMSSGTKNFHSKPKLDLEIAKTILASMGNRHRAGIDNYYSLPNDKVRSLHYREAARLMGFTDDFVFTVSKSQAIKQIGNSIVVDVLMNIIKAMKIDEEYQKRT